MSPFSGFPAGKMRLTPVPALFFSELLPQVDDLAELKMMLYVFWFLDRQEGSARYLTERDLAADERLVRGLGGDPQTALARALERCVQRGLLLKAAPQHDTTGEALYFLNSPRGRAAAAALEQGAWVPDQESHMPVTLQVERPNIYRLYEENIGPLTPLIADTLRDAENLYPRDWLEDAITLAVQKNARNWRYVEGILRSWKEKGRHAQDQGNAEDNRRKYVEGEYADFIEH